MFLSSSRVSRTVRGEAVQFFPSTTLFAAMSYDYESDHTKFMRSLFAKSPHLPADQRKGRAIWWDKSLDADEQRRLQESKVAQQPYVYQTKV